MNISVDLCFKILNFCLYVGLAIFVIKRNVIGYIKNLMIQEKQQILTLKDHHKHLQEVCSKISNQIKQDELSFATLRSKFELWHKQVNDQKLQEENVYLQRQQKNEILTIQKMQYLQRQYLIKQQVPYLLQDVEQALHKKFQEDKASCKKYQKTLLDTLGRLN